MTANSDFSDGLARCGWVDTSPEYIAYHDTEWGFPQGDDRALFEQLCLEGFQSGLSWRTILNKREAFRRGFAGFDPAKVARFDETRIQALLADAGIVRHRGKIEAVINNAGRALEMIEREGSLGAFLWRFEAPPGAASTRGASTSAQSEALSKALKKLGWKFVGPTTVYAFMQSVGMVNDHHPHCHCHGPSERARKAFRRPA
ncbi:DNA-3-methyladenine glycosylase I [Achromobacter ruhlandii]|uniref:DNA-3-methyladenine glycosylase I n=1 Tax=Achromobacter ruhlandii TaxID=72557 RepID=A0A848NSZ1_9BURK|nr:DNA-3-methyladenine glycosylase I [Achromobacter ruhlandii]NMU93621.1 DNA-3-methyladenine glycosylase I [Achromobacter ruhlandii]PJM90570.1 DNA-3-methyladenine glycosylase I [Achromobacter ruhlandii]